MEKGYIVFSDLHGIEENMLRLREIEREIDALGLISLGDLCPGITPYLYNSLISVRGNCDRYYEYNEIPFPPLSRAIKLFDKNILLYHGHIEFDTNGFDIVLTGHTHVPAINKAGNTYYFNPGSVSLPRSSTPPSFALLTPFSFSILSLIDLTVIDSLYFS